MELNLTFRNLGRSKIPIDYQYHLGSWIYHILAEANQEYADFLHNEGYHVSENDQRAFKLFCSSRLGFSRYEISDDRKYLMVTGDRIFLKIRFHIPKSMKTFIKGLFDDQNLTLKSGYNQMNCFLAESIEMKDVHIPSELDQTTINFDSPVVIGRKRADGGIDYISPSDEEYASLFYHNLLGKYKAAGLEVPNHWNPGEWTLSHDPSSRLESKLHQIKQSDQKTKVRGYRYTCTLAAPAALINTGLLAGFGKHCAYGMGFGEVVE